VTFHVQAAGRTHVGHVRPRNEDAFYLGRSLLAVADGLGGHVAGDVASTTVIDMLRAHDQAADPTALPDALGRAVSEANTALRQRITAAPDLAGMGTTLVAMLHSDATAVLANIGDSRAYRLRRARSVPTAQITEDHTYGHLVADARRVPRLDARLARFLDGRPDGRSPDLTRLDLEPGDRFLLCSDGLSSFVPYELIDVALRTTEHPDEAVDRLMHQALEQGGHDNITVVVIDIG
jgi:protein phosphatase